MTIKEKGYTHWDGELVRKRIPWWPITRYGIRLTFQKKFFKFLLFLSLVPALVFLVAVYLSERLEDFEKMLREGGSRLLQVNPSFFKLYLTNDFLLFMMVVVLVFAGAGLIADDLKFNSLQLYLSRPIKKRDYFFGKAAVITFFMFLLTLIPGLILFFMKILFSGSVKFFLSYPWLLFSIIGYSVLVTVFFSFYALFISSMSKNRRYVIIVIFGMYFFSDILYGIFYGIFRDDRFALLSIKANLQQIGAYLFGVRPEFSIHWSYSMAYLVGLCILAGLILNRKVKGVEIVK
jgi:ABC-type transport system involved in multi-copper enzyme maturation permease subunit